MELGKLKQPKQPRSATAPQRLKPMAYIDAVLVEQWHHVCHRAHSRQTDTLEQHCTQARSDLLGTTRSRGNRPGKFEGHTSAAELAKWVVFTWQSWVDQDIRLRQFIFERMVVGNDQF